jgi:hypothetical protein
LGDLVIANDLRTDLSNFCGWVTMMPAKGAAAQDPLGSTHGHVH